MQKGGAWICGEARLARETPQFMVPCNMIPSQSLRMSTRTLGKCIIIYYYDICSDDLGHACVMGYLHG